MTRVNQGLFSTTMEAEKRDPGNEVEFNWLDSYKIAAQNVGQFLFL